MYSLGRNAKSIVMSDKTQAFIDCVNLDKKVTIYSLGQLNFISSFLSKDIEPENYKNISFYSLNKPKDDLKLFRSIFLKSEKSALASSIENISNPCLEINSISMNEIAIWEYVYGDQNRLSSKNLKFIMQILKSTQSNKNFDLKNFEKEILTISMKTSLTIYLLNQIVYGHINNENEIKDILQNLITPNFVQYFYLETQQLKFFLNRMRIEIEIQKEAMEVFNNSLKVSIGKSRLLHLIILLETKANTLKINYIRTQIYKILDFLMICAIRLKR